MDGSEQARDDLLRWREGQPGNFFASDPLLQILTAGALPTLGVAAHRAARS